MLVKIFKSISSKVPHSAKKPNIKNILLRIGRTLKPKYRWKILK
jgi:hypothetical protein